MPQPEYNPDIRPIIETQPTLEAAHAQAVDVADFENRLQVDEKDQRNRKRQQEMMQTEAEGGSLPPIDNSNNFEDIGSIEKGKPNELLKELGASAIEGNRK